MALKDRPQPRHALEAPIAPVKRRGHMSFGRKVLLTVMTLGTVGTTIGAGTFASFTASTNNTGNVFATGNLVLGDKTASSLGAGDDTEFSMCFSTTTSNTDTNVNSSCGQAFNFTLNKPGSTSTVDFNLKNKGSIAGLLTLARGTCTDADIAGTEFNGTGNLCSTGVNVMLQEYSDNARTTASVCWYGTSSPVAGACTADTSKTISSLSTSGLTLNGSPGATTMTSGTTRYFRLTLNLPVGASPTLQGRSATFDLTWKLTSA